MNADERRETGSRTKSDFPAGSCGGSVLDGTKFIAAAANYPEISIRGTFCKRAVKKLKAPSRGLCADAASNRFRIQRRRGDPRKTTGDKQAFHSAHVQPVFPCSIRFIPTLCRRVRWLTVYGCLCAHRGTVCYQTG